jgi:hypothetical protein
MADIKPIISFLLYSSFNCLKSKSGKFCYNLQWIVILFSAIFLRPSSITYIYVIGILISPTGHCIFWTPKIAPFMCLPTFWVLSLILISMTLCKQICISLVNPTGVSSP